MNRPKIHFCAFAVALCVLLIAPSATYAQRGGDRPEPGASGGSAGGPGMSGAAMNAGRSTAQVSAPSVDLSAPSGNNAMNGSPASQGGRGGGSRTGGLGGTSVSNPAGDFNGDGQTDGPLAGFGRGGSGPIIADFDGDGRPDTGGFTGLGGFAPFSGQGGGLQGRFGERGASTLTLDSFFTTAEGIAGWQMQVSQGGFGTRSEGSPESAAGLESQAELDQATWDPSAEDGWSAPAAYDDLDAVALAQENAQVAVDQAIQEASDQAQATADAMTETAQDAYNQFWEDYYEAVDYTAQVYYDTVTAEYDYMLQTYQEAVDYTSAAVDYYLDYAAQYATYCALYPWDCYSYVYDATANTYVYVGSISDAPVATVEVGTVTSSAALPAASAPTPSAEAYEAIVLFANDQLGAVVEPRYAGSATEQVQALLNRLPPEMQAYVASMASISGQSYWGLLYGGVATVMVGDCTTGDCTVTADNLDVQLSSSAAGVYGLLAESAMPATPAEALALITQVYPKLDGLAFARISDIEAGYAFTATTASLGYDPQTHQPVSAAKIVYGGVIEANGRPFVYALVALGEGYVSILS